jgi:TetR/AcrR family transcriptional regulator
MNRQTRQAARRRPGRPAAGATDQRERLLDAALASFADKGIAATSLRALAQASGLTAAMLNYYFGTRERLVEAVVEERLLPAIAEQRDRLVPVLEGDSRTLAERFVAGLHTTIERHPWLPALWVREVLTEGGELRHVFLERIGPVLPQPLVERFAAGQARGEISRELDPRLLFVSLIGLTMLPFAAAPLWRQVFDAEDINSERMLSHTLALLAGGLKP